MLLRGCFRILLLYDVAEALDLDKLRELLGPRAESIRRVFPRRTPEYVTFEQTPILEHTEPILLPTGESFACSIKYHAFAVAVVQCEIPFSCDWQKLLEQASRWSDNAEIEQQARALLKKHLELLTPAIVRPMQDWLNEEYLLINLEQIGNGSDAASPPTETHGQQDSNQSADQLLAEHGHEIAQLVRGELAPLSPRTVDEALEPRLSYYATDLVVIGASAALIYDRSEDAAAADVVLEYAKMQLLEFRYYDRFMTQLLSEVYNSLDEKRNVLLSRWSVPRDIKRTNTIRLDVMELTERVDNAIKFVSDVYYARLYRLAATRMGVPDYRDLVDEKLKTLGELYDAMVDQFNEARSFVLEVGIAILCLLDVLFLFRGK